MASYKELKAKAEELMQQAETARRAEVAEVIADIKAKIAEYGIALKDLGGGVKKPLIHAASRIKFRNPSNARETWSGRGRPPRWIADEIAKGRKREEFLVE